jgi:tetratricopeptide (TPR) repeat protein
MKRGIGFILWVLFGFYLSAQDNRILPQVTPQPEYQQKLQELGRQLEELRRQHEQVGNDPRQQLEQEMAELTRLRQVYQSLQKPPTAFAQPVPLSPEIAKAWERSAKLQVITPAKVADSPGTWLALADLYWQQKRYSEALDAYLQYQKKQTKLPAMVFYRIAYAHEKNGEWPKAEEYYQRLSTEYSDTYLGKEGGWCLQYLRWKRETVEQLARYAPQALTSHPAPPTNTEPVPAAKIPTAPANTESVPAAKIQTIAQYPGKWYTQLARQLKRLRALDLTQWQVAETKSSIEANKINGYVVTMGHYPKEIQKLASELQQCVNSGKDVATWIKLQTPNAATQSKLEQLKILQTFWQTGEMPLETEADIAALAKEIGSLAAVDRRQTVSQGDIFAPVCRLLEKIHEQYEKLSQTLTSGVTNFQVAE